MWLHEERLVRCPELRVLSSSFVSYEMFFVRITKDDSGFSSPMHLLILHLCHGHLETVVAPVMEIKMKVS